MLHIEKKCSISPVRKQSVDFRRTVLIQHKKKFNILTKGNASCKGKKKSWNKFLTTIVVLFPSDDKAS